MRKTRVVVALAATMAMVASFALPALADSDVGTVGPGTAEVGSFFTSGPTQAGDCTIGRDGAPNPGLYLLNPLDPRTIDRQGVFKLVTRVTAALRGGGLLSICGYLSPVDATAVDDEKPQKKDEGLGAACGMSQGHDGTGKIAWDPGGPVASSSLTHVGWLATAGGTLPVKGDVQDNPSTTDKTKLKSGLLLAQVQAQGGQDCVLNANGAKSFQVAGAFEVLQGQEKGHA